MSTEDASSQALSTHVVSIIPTHVRAQATALTLARVRDSCPAERAGPTGLRAARRGRRPTRSRCARAVPSRAAGARQEDGGGRTPWCSRLRWGRGAGLPPPPGQADPVSVGEAGLPAPASSPPVPRPPRGRHRPVRGPTATPAPAPAVRLDAAAVADDDDDLAPGSERRAERRSPTATKGRGGGRQDDSDSGGGWPSVKRRRLAKLRRGRADGGPEA